MLKKSGPLKIGILLLILLESSWVFSWPRANKSKKERDPVFYLKNKINHNTIGPPKGLVKTIPEWVEKKIESMSLSEKIGQLIMVSLSSKSGPEEIQKVRNLIDQYKIGGIGFLKGGPVNQERLSRYFQKISYYPLFMAMDAENGLGMRLDSLISFPHQLSLGAIRDNDLIYQMGLEVARESRLLGISMSFSPVLDVNDNFLNPIINERSFGEDPHWVAEKGIALMRGLQDGGLIAVAKHFPGHGSSDMDSHKLLPTIDRDKKTLDSIDLLPFKAIIENGVSGIMIGHLNVPSLDPSPNSKASLSKIITDQLLRKEMNFKGLVLTDALNMGALNQANSLIKVSSLSNSINALIAGNDILVFPPDIPGTIKAIYEAIDQKKLSIADLDKKVEHILIAKYKAGLFDDSKKNVSASKGIIEQINSPQAILLKEKLAEASLTLLGNKDQTFPLRNLENEKIAVLSIGQVEDNTFQNTLNRYAPVKRFSAWADEKEEGYNKLLDSLKNYSTLILGLHNLEKSDQDNFGIRQQTLEFIRKIHNPNLILVVFGNPYLLSNFENIPNVLVAYEDNSFTEKLSAEVLFGAISPLGRLPVSVSRQFKKGDGVTYPITHRLKFVIPESIGISSNYLFKVDSIALDGIKNHAYPGCVVLAAKDGKVFYEKAFGTHSYADPSPTKVDDVFDLASVTKITSTVLGVMKIYDQKLIKIDDPLSAYLPGLENSNKKDITLKELLTHQAGLIPFIPFYVDALKDPSVFRRDSSSFYSWRVAENMYERNNYFSGTMWPRIIDSPLKTRGTYVYSDLSMYFMRAVLEKVSGEDLKTFVTTSFYRPLGLSNTGFNPRSHIPLSRMMPSEDDTLFRKQQLLGDVHDQGAAMQNGVGGHAGLFSNVSDLAILGQMLLNQGEYAGRIYIKPETVKLFNTRPYPKTSRRGLGFDKPDLDIEKYPAVPKMVSTETFGHTGFTGTCIWIDPVNKIIYIFLSNRVCPKADNNMISSLSVRPKIQAVFYEALLDKRK